MLVALRKTSANSFLRARSFSSVGGNFAHRPKFSPPESEPKFTESVSETPAESAEGSIVQETVPHESVNVSNLPSVEERLVDVRWQHDLAVAISETRKPHAKPCIILDGQRQLLQKHFELDTVQFLQGVSNVAGCSHAAREILLKECSTTGPGSAVLAFESRNTYIGQPLQLKNKF